MSHQLFIRDLQVNCRGQVLSDVLSLGIYATDASIYQIRPIVVVIPKDQEDTITAVRIAADHRISIVPRGGGTGLAGQAIGQAMILDLSKNLRQILDFNPVEKWIVVQPGVVRDTLNRFLAPHGLHFAPDPATSSRANIGGMIANNSSGTKSIIYGKTIDHVLELKVLLSDGTMLHLNRKNKSEYEDICRQSSREGDIYSSVKNIIDHHAQSIRQCYPKVMRRVGGYNLDELLDPEARNLSKLITGSEGTLGIILQAKINLTPLPACKYVCLCHFATMQAAIKATQKIVNYYPAAVEIIDRTVIELSRQNLATKNSCRVIVGDPEAVLIVEFHGDTSDETRQKAEQMANALSHDRIGYAHPVFPEGEEYNDILTVRKKGLGLMIGMKSRRKPVAFIEDAAIPLEHLPEYIAEVDSICKKYGVDAIKYAHVSVGLIHVRPVLDLRDPGDVELLKKIAEETFLLVKKYKGAWSGEHGDGLVRSPFNERFFGMELYQAFRDIKEIFDPAGLMNPGKIIDAPPLDHNLRYGEKYLDMPFNTVFHYRETGSFHAEVHMCSGVGECRKTDKGTMCPSFMATRDEADSTRGRANILRLAMSGQIGKEGLLEEAVLSALDLCLSCKACKSECPSNVDMARLKSEVWQLKHDRQGISLRDRFVRDSTRFARWFSGPPASLINRVQGSPVFRFSLEKIARIERRRILPSYTGETFTTWYERNYSPPDPIRDTVFLFADTYLNYHEPSIGIATVRLLKGLGVHSEIINAGCCQRPRISNGFLKQAKSEGASLMTKLADLVKTGRPILVCEPSCASALQFDLPDLMDDENLVKDIPSHISTVADYLIRKIKSGWTLPTLKPSRIYLHGHCHEKALYGIQSIREIIEMVGGRVKVIDSGCCGMAGAFGYEKEHYELSEKIGRDRLFDVINQMPEDSLIVASGFSCRHQIEHFTNRKVHFWTEVFH